MEHLKKIEHGSERMAHNVIIMLNKITPVILFIILMWLDGSRKIEIRCFCIDPSVKSSLRFLRTTPWAREKVESLYLYVLRQKAKQKS